MSGRHPRLHVILSENWTMADPRDLVRFVGLASVVERAGLDGVMIGEHVVMGPNSAFRGEPENPRDWLMAGNQDPRYPHPSSMVVLSAMAAVTERIQLTAGALLTPLRHPLTLAKDLATLDLVSRGRLVVIPGVSWQREEYAALGVPFTRRGKILDEQLEIWRRLWSEGSPVSAAGEHFMFDEIYVEPAPFRAGGPALWAGGKEVSPWLIRRAARYASGFFPIVAPKPEDMELLDHALAAQGRSMSDLRIASFVFGPPFQGADDLLDLDRALAGVPDLLSLGVTDLVVKPAQFVNDVDRLGDFCSDLRLRVRAISSAVL